MKLNEIDGVKFYTFELFEKTGIVNHGFSTRIGGVSEGCFKSLNLSFSRGDDYKKVYENFSRMAKAMDSDIKSLTIARQSHETEIRYVTKADCGRGIDRERYPESYDGLMTDEAGVMLVTLHADCVPIYFLDSKKKAVALCHAGWRGTVNKIAEKTVYEMKKKFGSEQKDILVGIGPAISFCCFEVGGEVKDEFERKLPFSIKHIRNGEKEGKFYIDLKAVNFEILRQAGIEEKNIEVSGECTKCLEEEFFSHRRMGESRGSMAAFLSLKEMGTKN